MASITLGAGITFGAGISSNDESTTPVLFSLDGSTFNGWGLSGSPTVDAVVGNPAPSYKITAANHFFRRNFGQTFHDKTITFDWRPQAGADAGFLFAQNFGGNGSNRVSLRMVQRADAYKQGLGSVDNGGWLYLGDPSYSPIPETTAIFTTANVWYNIKIQITSARVCTWYVNDVLQLSTYTIPIGYTTANTTDTWFGFLGNNLGGTWNVDNFKIYNGIV